MPVRPLALVVLALAVAVPVHAQVYKWTGPDGRTHYGDRPPDEVKAQSLRIGVQSHSGPAVQDTWTDVIRRPPPPTTAQPGALPITFYSTAWCPHCKRARLYFARKGLEVREVDVEASEEGLREFREFGGQGVPLILVGEQRLRGFDEAAMDKLLAPSRRGGS